MVLWAVATLVAFYVKGLCGFANTLVFTSILGFGVNNVEISPVELILGYPSNIILTWKHRNELDKKVYLPLAVLVILGSIPGAFLLKNVDARYIKLVFGLLVILLGIEMYLRDAGRIKFNESKIMLLVIGIISGVICGLFGVGALLAAYVGRVAETSKEFKANISAVFIVENTFRMVLYSAMGIITVSSFKYALLLLPFTFLGLFLGIKSSEFLKEKYAKLAVIALLIISGVSLILKNL